MERAIWWMDTGVSGPRGAEVYVGTLKPACRNDDACTLGAREAVLADTEMPWHATRENTGHALLWIALSESWTTGLVAFGKDRITARNTSWGRPYAHPYDSCHPCHIPARVGAASQTAPLTAPRPCTSRRWGTQAPAASAVDKPVWAGQLSTPGSTSCTSRWAGEDRVQAAATHLFAEEAAVPVPVLRHQVALRGAGAAGVLGAGLRVGVPAFGVVRAALARHLGLHANGHQ